MPLGDFKKIKLSKDEEIDLITKSKTACVCKGNPLIKCCACDSKSKLVEAHLRWILKLCVEHSKVHSYLNISPEEFMADAIEAFTNAINDYSLDHKARLLTYSAKPVVCGLLASDLSQGVILIPVWVRTLKSRIFKVVRKSREKGRKLTFSEISEEVNESVTTVRNALSTVECDLGLSTVPIGLKNNCGRGGYLIDQTTDPDYFSTEDSDEWMFISDIKTLMSQLSDEEHKIICAKVGLGQDKMTINEMKSRFGFSRRKISNIYNSGIKRMSLAAGVEINPKLLLKL